MSNCEAIPLQGQPHAGPETRVARICPQGHYRQGIACASCTGEGAAMCNECEGEKPAIIIAADTFDEIINARLRQQFAEAVARNDPPVILPSLRTGRPMDRLTMTTAVLDGIPPGCICAYTWANDGSPRVVRNGAVASCPADHAQPVGADAEPGDLDGPPQHPELAASVRDGITQCETGQTADLGSFGKYADADDAPPEDTSCG